MTAVARKSPQQLVDFYTYRLNLLRNSRDPARKILMKVYESLIAHNLKLLEVRRSNND